MSVSAIRSATFSMDMAHILALRRGVLTDLSILSEAACRLQGVCREYFCRRMGTCIGFESSAPAHHSASLQVARATWYQEQREKNQPWRSSIMLSRASSRRYSFPGS